MSMWGPPTAYGMLIWLKKRIFSDNDDGGEGTLEMLLSLGDSLLFDLVKYPISALTLFLSHPLVHLLNLIK
jgi:hypothetical protein